MVTWRSPVAQRHLIDILVLVPKIALSAGFSTADAWACGIDESQVEYSGRCQIPSHSVSSDTSRHPLRR
jgi:hypothetical protein